MSSTFQIQNLKKKFLTKFSIKFKQKNLWMKNHWKIYKAKKNSGLETGTSMKTEKHNNLWGFVKIKNARNLGFLGIQKRKKKNWYKFH